MAAFVFLGRRPPSAETGELKMATDSTPIVTPEQDAQALLVQHDLVEYMNRQLGEKMDYRILLAGLAAAAADLIHTKRGWDAVPVWFAVHAQVTAAQIAAARGASKAR
jgi:hypothetical protein